MPFLLNSRHSGVKGDPNSDFDWHLLYRAEGDKMQTSAKSDLGVWMTGDAVNEPVEKPSGVLSWLWNKALAEWQDITPQPVQDAP